MESSQTNSIQSSLCDDSTHAEATSEPSSDMLKQLVVNAEKNALKLPQQRRHELVLKTFATSLYILSGPMAYNFIHRNLPEAIPSL